jgi:hypothetical protein
MLMQRVGWALAGAARAGQHAAAAAARGIQPLPRVPAAAAAAASAWQRSLARGSGGAGQCCGMAAQRAAQRCLSSAAAAEPAEAPTKTRKAVTWYGARISTDPTAPSVIRRRPTTPSQRHTAIIDKTYLWRGKPVKTLTKGIKRSGARNNQGVTTVWGKGGGNKRRYRLIDFKRAHPKSTGVVSGIVERIEYDPNRTALIALLRHPQHDEGYEGERHAALSYILCPRGIAVGNELQASRTQLLDVKPGNSMQLRHMPVGTLVHNIELRPGQCVPRSPAFECALPGARPLLLPVGR